MTSDHSDVLILGASFAGIELYHQLRRSTAGRKLSITIVDRQPEHGYIPLCQERLVLRLQPESSLLPTRRCVNAPGTRYLVDEVTALDAEHQVRLASGARLSSRFLVVALGSALAPPPQLPGHEHLLGYKQLPSKVGYKWERIDRGEKGDKLLVSPHGKNGTIVQAASVGEFKDFAAFQAAIRALPLEFKLAPVPTVKMRTLRGKEIAFTYGQAPKVDGKKIDYAKW